MPDLTLESAPGELTTVFAQLQGMMLGEDDATIAVQHLARVAHQMIASSNGAGVSLLSDDGDRTSSAYTGDSVQAADALQYELGQGPCLSAWATGELQRVDDTLTDDRWASWQEAAAELGIRSVFSVPLSHRGRSLGALKVYARARGFWTG